MMQKILIGFLVLVVVISTAAILLSGNDEPATVRITVGGTTVNEIPLSSNSLPKTITVNGKDGGENTVVIEEGRVSISHADCPDQICVQQGWITDGTLPIVCLPHEVIVEIVGGESSGMDTATG